MLNDVWRESGRLMKHIETVKPGTDEYDKVLREIMDLIHIQDTVMKRPEWESRISKFVNNQALVGGVFTIGTTLLVLHYERLEIITSRAFSWIRPK